MNRKAFTLLELLVSMAILGLLVGLVALSLRGVRESSRRAASVNALRQMVFAHISYSDDHRKILMPGYLSPATLIDLDLPAKLEDGTDLRERQHCRAQVCTGSSYVWRLAPYLDHAWRTYYTDLQDPGLLSRLQAEYDRGI